MTPRHKQTLFLLLATLLVFPTFHWSFRQLAADFSARGPTGEPFLFFLLEPTDPIARHEGLVPDDLSVAPAPSNLTNRLEQIASLQRREQRHTIRAVIATHLPDADGHRANNLLRAWVAEGFLVPHAAGYSLARDHEQILADYQGTEHEPLLHDLRDHLTLSVTPVNDTLPADLVSLEALVVSRYLRYAEGNSDTPPQSRKYTLTDKGRDRLHTGWYARQLLVLNHTRPFTIREFKNRFQLEGERQALSEVYELQQAGLLRTLPPAYSPSWLFSLLRMGDIYLLITGLSCIVLSSICIGIGALFARKPGNSASMIRRAAAVLFWVVAVWLLLHHWRIAPLTPLHVFLGNDQDTRLLSWLLTLALASTSLSLANAASTRILPKHKVLPYVAIILLASSASFHSVQYPLLVRLLPSDMFPFLSMNYALHAEASLPFPGRWFWLALLAAGSYHRANG